MTRRSSSGRGSGGSWLAMAGRSAHQLTVAPTMKNTPILRGLSAALSLCVSTVGLAAHGEGAGAHGSMLYTPDKMVWKDGPGSFEKGAQFVVLEGDPAK